MTDYHIDVVNGADSNDGLTKVNAWKTLARFELGPDGIGGSYSGGDTIYVYAGEYFEKADVPDSGSIGSLITLQAVDDDGDVIINGSEPAGGFVAYPVDPALDGGFEVWTDPATPTHWTKWENGTSTVNQETSGMYKGSSCLKLITDASGSSCGVYAALSRALADNQWHRVSGWHREPCDPGDITAIEVAISRGPLGNQEFWNYLTGTWGPQGGTQYYKAMNYADLWRPGNLDFDTGANPNALHGYYIWVRSFSIIAYAQSKTYYVDEVEVGEIDIKAVTNGNYVGNGDMEDWDNPNQPTGWTITNPAGTGSVNKELVDVWEGTESCEILTDAAANVIAIDRDIGDLTNSKMHRLTFKHKEVAAGNAALQISIARGDIGLGTAEYLQADGTWGAPGGGVVTIPFYQALGWKQDEFKFDTGLNLNSKSPYNLRFLPFTAGGYGVSASHLIDGAKIEEMDTNPVKNMVVDPGFEDLVDGILNTQNWVGVAGGTATIAPSKEKVNGSWGMVFTTDAADSTIDLTSRAITLKKDRVYRVGIHHHEEGENGGSDAELGVRIKRFTTPATYWNAATEVWQTTPVDMMAEYQPEFGLMAGKIKTIDEDANQTYAMQIRYVNGTGHSNGFERLFFDDVSIVEQDPVGEVYECSFQAAVDPAHVYVTGRLGGKYVDRVQLHNEGSSTYPHLNCFGYTTSTKKLYVNVGEDPGDLLVECSIRDYGINFNGESYLQADGFKMMNFVDKAVDLGYKASGPRPTDVKATNIWVRRTGRCGIVAGFHPADPTAAGQPVPTDDHLTPANITVDDCDIYQYNRNKTLRIASDGVDAGATWNTGFAYMNCGIRVSPGEDYIAEDGDEIGDVRIRRCLVKNDHGGLNRNTEINGVSVALGNNILIEDVEVDGTDHGIVVMGKNYTKHSGRGDARYFHIRNCRGHDTGDDCIWVWGIPYYGSKITGCLVYNSPDNGIDVNTCGTVEVYNNTFYNCRNEMVAVWGSGVQSSSAIILNNIFHSWGSWLVQDPGLRLGVAIGFTSASPAYSMVDHNHYYKDPSQVGYDKPFHVDQAQKTAADMLADWGFDAHSSFGVDPKLRNPTGGDLTLRHDSPCIDGGFDLAEFVFDLGDLGIVVFQNDDLDTSILDPDSEWPGGVQRIAQETLGLATTWDRGAFAYITEKHLVVFSKYGAPTEDLSPVVDIWRTVGGEIQTPAPIVYEIGGGVYAYSTRVIQKMVARVDGEDGTFHAGDRYRFQESIPDAGYLRMLEEKFPDGDVVQAIDDQLGGTYGVGPWAGQSEWTEDQAQAMRKQAGVPESGTVLIEPTEGTLKTMKDLSTVIDGKADTIQAKTDGLNFVGDDVKSTLDSEVVTTANAADVTSILADTGAIKAKTDTLPVDPADQSILMAAIVSEFLSHELAVVTQINANEVKIDAIQAKTVNLPGDPADQSSVESKIDSALASHQSAVISQIDANETKIDSVIAKTDNLPSDPADQSLVEAKIDAALTTHEATVISQIDANEVKIDGVKAKTDNLPADPADHSQIMTAVAGVGTTADSIWAKVGSYPSDIWSQAEAEAYIDALQTAILTPLAVVDGNVDDVLARVKREMVLMFENALRHTRVYVAGQLASEILTGYKTGAGLDALDPLDVEAEYEFTYTYKVGTDQVDTLKSKRV